MRMLALVVLLGCSGSSSGQLAGTQTYSFGPFTLAPGEELESKCVQISIDNEDYANVNVVELTTGPGFHHSNWFYVPEFTFPGPDGTFTCDDRGFEQAVAATHGGVIFAQSTQAPHEVQAFPEGVVVRVPPRSKLVAQLHLLNATDTTLALAPDIKLTYVNDADVRTRLAGLSFQNAALALPPGARSRFTVECDLDAKHRALLGRAPDFKIYYALAHYHDLGTQLVVEAVKPDGDAATIYTTANAVGDSLGGLVEPQFDMTGYTKVRFACEFYNPRADTVGWGIGDQEMCVFLAFTDATYNFGGGVLEEVPPENPMLDGATMTYSNPCVTFAIDADRG